MEPTIFNAAAEKVFGIPELYRIICHGFRGLVSPCAMAIEAAKTEHDDADTQEWYRQLEHAPASRRMHIKSVHRFVDAGFDGSIHDAGHLSYCRGVHSCNRSHDSARVARFGLLRRPLRGAATVPAEPVDSLRRASPNECNAHIWWNWIPVMPSAGARGQRPSRCLAPPGTLALLQARLLPDISDIIRSEAHHTIHSKPCGVGLTVGYRKDKLIELARDACPADAQPRPEWDKPRIVRHILAN